MAGISLGAAAPTPTLSLNLAPRTLYRVPTSTRTRRLAGVCLAADALVSVYRSRQNAGSGNPVTLVLQSADGEHQARLSATQAQSLGAALIEAAELQGGAQ